MTVTRVWLEPREIRTVDLTVPADTEGEWARIAAQVGSFAIGKVFRLRASGPEAQGAELRAHQREVAALLLENGAAHVALDAPALEPAGVPAGTPGDLPGPIWRTLPAEEAVDRWLAEHPPKGADAGRVRAAMLEAVKIGGRDGR